MNPITEAQQIAMAWVDTHEEIMLLSSDILKFARSQVNRVTQEFGIYTGATTDSMYEKGMQVVLDTVRNGKLKILAELTEAE